MYFYEFNRDKNNEFIVSTEPSVSPDKHFHNCMEIIYIIDGATTAHIDGEIYNLSSGQLCAISCFSTHYYENCREGQYIICLIPHRYFREVEEVFNTNSFANPVIDDVGNKPFLSILRILQTQKELSLNFKKTMNMSIVAYIDQVRTLEAGRLLNATSKTTVETVMLESGFKSTRSFLRHFKNIYGCTPTEYKNRQS